jgi:predicted nucleic acid-binding protein
VRLLDTDVMIDVLREFKPALDWLESLGDEPALGLPGFVVMELIVGAQNNKDLERLKSQHHLKRRFEAIRRTDRCCCPDS